MSASKIAKDWQMVITHHAKGVTTFPPVLEGKW